MVGCVLVMAPTGLECTQDMRNGTVAGGGATSPRGGQASHHPRALVLQPTDATSGVDPAAVRPFGWGARGVTGLTREKVRQERERERQRARGSATQQKGKRGRVAFRDCSPIQKVRSVINDP